MGFVSDLPDKLNRPFPDVPVYNPNRKKDGEPVEERGNWETLQPGHGYGHRVERGGQPVYSDRFGPEITFAPTMKARNPNQNIALFKYARGGSSIHPDTPDDWGCWDPDFVGINQWTHFSHHYKRVLRTWSDPNSKLEPAGLIWMQGESDAAYSRKIARDYAENLAKVISSMRALTGNPDLPVVIAQISGTGVEGDEPALPHAAIVQQAQQSFVENDPNAKLVTPPQNHGWLDAWHYDSPTYLEMGRRLAEAMSNLVNDI